MQAKRAYSIVLGKMLQNESEGAFDEQVPYLKAMHIQWDEIIWDDLPKMWAAPKEIDALNVAKGDLLVCEGGDVGRAALVKTQPDEPTIIQNALHLVRGSERGDVRFLAYCLRNASDQGWFDVLCNRSTIAHFTVEKFRELWLCLPPLPTQQRIADYLDVETQHIDELIAAKRSMLALLEKKRAALVSQAVTKGLDPNAKLKDSGLEWLGEIPEGWQIKPLRYWGWCQNGISQGADYFGSGYPFVNYGDVYRSEALPFEVEGLANSTDADRILYSVEKGDVFFTRTSETIGEIGMAATCLKTIENGIFSGFVIRVRPFAEELAVGFSKYYFRSQALRVFFMREMNIITRASMSQDLLKQLPVLVPPMKEQLAIAEHLDKWNAQYTALSADLTESITLLNSRRSALITAAVTGQLGI
jgi:type I restriction enzyme S subunit